MDESTRWRSWPALERPKSGLLALALVGLLAWSVTLASGDWMWGAIALLAMFLALIGFFLPTDVQLSESQIMVSDPLRVRSMRWDSILVCQDGGDALLLMQRGSRRLRRGRLQVPLGREEFIVQRRRAIERFLRAPIEGRGQRIF